MITASSCRPAPSFVPFTTTLHTSSRPQTVSPEIRPRGARFTRLEFRDATGLSCHAVDRFVARGFIKPLGVWENGRKEIYYSVEDVKKVRLMMSLLNGKLNLIQAHEQAEAMLNDSTLQGQEKARKALESSSADKRIEDPYAMPKDWQKPEDSDSEQHPDTAPKPRRVNLSVTHKDGTLECLELSGKQVPAQRDWEERADNLWLESRCSEHGPVVSVRMEDEAGLLYLQELAYHHVTGTSSPVSSHCV